MVVMRTKFGFLPTLLTLGNLLGGFLAIAMSFAGYFDHATIAIALGAVCDAFDGRAARFTQTSSRFGAELDSLADAVSFGVAPGILMYTWIASQFGDHMSAVGGVFTLAAAVCYFYTACTVLRLAIFNVASYEANTFRGLPSPAAAFVILSLYHTMNMGSYIINPQWIPIICFAVLIAVALSMVSKVTHIKNFQFKSHPVRWTVACLAAILVIFGYEWRFVFATPFVYWLGSFVFHGVKKLSSKPQKS